MLEQVNFEKKFSSLPQFKPEECQSPSAISVPSSPRVFNYPKKRSMPSGHRSSLDEETEPETPQSASSSRHVIGTTFFGPDFNIENMKGRPGVPARLVRILMGFCFSDMAEMGEASSPRTPVTPETSRDGEKGYRRILEKRRQLVMKLFRDEQSLFPTAQATSSFQAQHTDIFPSKSSLQLKIREVRQKLMAQNSHTPTSANSQSSPLTPAEPIKVSSNS